jgi:hypothetical protein
MVRNDSGFFFLVMRVQQLIYLLTFADFFLDYLFLAVALTLAGDVVAIKLDVGFFILVQF